MLVLNTENMGTVKYEESNNIMVSLCKSIGLYTKLRNLEAKEIGDVFYQLDAGAVDILLVVDNSCSMQPYQQELANNFDSFLTYFIEGDVDYQIGVTTTTVTVPDPYGSCTSSDIAAIPTVGTLVNNTVVNVDTANASQVFSDLVNVGVCGSGIEMGLKRWFARIGKSQCWIVA